MSAETVPRPPVHIAEAGYGTSVPPTSGIIDSVPTLAELHTMGYASGDTAIPRYEYGPDKKRSKAGEWLGRIAGRLKGFGSVTPVVESVGQPTVDTQQPKKTDDLTQFMPPSMRPTQTVASPGLPEIAQSVWYAPEPTTDSDKTIPRAATVTEQQPLVPTQRVDLFAPVERVVSDKTDVYNAANVERARQDYESKVASSEKAEDKNTAELMASLKITSGIRIGKRSLMLSDVVQGSGGRMHCVMYTELADGSVAPRLLYKSTSEGEWRVSPHVEKWTDQNGRRRMRYSKGETMDYGYVRETRLDDDLRVALANKEGAAVAWEEGSIDWLTDHFTKDKLGKNDTYETEAGVTELTEGTIPKSEIEQVGKNILAFMPGHGFESTDGRTAAQVFAEAKVPYNKMPNFADSNSSLSESNHPILGKVETETFSSNDGRYTWHLSSDEEGRVWVSGVTRANNETPTSYGTDTDVLSLGILDNKPIEYDSQVQGLRPGIDFVPAKIGNKVQAGYVDITPLLDNLELVKAYRQARGIVRKSQ